MQINSYKTINLYNEVSKWSEILENDKISIGDLIIVNYTPKFESNFDKGCVYVIRKQLFDLKVVDKQEIIPIFFDIHKQASRAIDKFKTKYSIEIVVKCS